jgi:exodeoxyribonuclease V alpha subunit
VSSWPLRSARFRPLRQIGAANSRETWEAVELPGAELPFTLHCQGHRLVSGNALSGLLLGVREGAWLLWQLRPDPLPLGLTALARALQNTLEISAAAAARMVATCGLGVLERLQNDPGALELASLQQEELELALRRWPSVDWRAFLLQQLGELGVGDHFARRLLEICGLELPAALHRDPYEPLLQAGLPFEEADAVALATGLSLDDPRRLGAGAVAVIAERGLRQGHSALPPGQVSRSLVRKLQLGRQQVEQAIEAGILGGRLVEQGDLLYLREIWEAERELAARVAARLSHPTTSWPLPKAALSGLEEAQKLALAQAASWELSVLTGGPGTGKSYTAGALVRWAQEAGKSVLLCAPTGKAAKRLEELAGAAPASTIHRLLQYGRDGSFGRDARNPLEADLIVVDEASMCGTSLLLALLRAAPEGAHLVIAGDPQQLAPVDWGAPLRDLMELAPTCKLERIFRQGRGSPVLDAAYALRSGKVPSPGAQLPFLPADQDSGAERIAELACQLGGARKVQVLTPVQGGGLGVTSLNLAIQQLVNPGRGGVRSGPYQIRSGDLVVQTRNNYALEIFNGTQGSVLEAREGALLVDFEGRVLAVRGKDLLDLQLSYALTVHRAQGSEWPTVIAVLHRAQRPMLLRELAYTAVTRTSLQLILAGELEAWEEAARTPAPPRWSNLRALLEETISAPRPSL